MVDAADYPSHPSWVCGLKLLIAHLVVVLIESHPSWVCGLKLECPANVDKPGCVTPFVGVWIETTIFIFIVSVSEVTPFVGVWIETFLLAYLRPGRPVTPFVGVWIETELSIIALRRATGHTLRGCVD